MPSVIPSSLGQYTATNFAHIHTIQQKAGKLVWGSSLNVFPHFKTLSNLLFPENR